MRRDELVANRACFVECPVQTASEAQLLIKASAFEHALTQVLRIAVEGTLDPSAATSGLKALLVRTGNVTDFTALEAKLADLQDRVSAIFDGIFRAA